MDLRFPSNEADENEGLADAGIETFRDAPYASVARETGQNSRDATAGGMVTLRFDRIEISAEQIPAIDEFKITLKHCAERAKSSNNSKEIQFFQRALEIINKPSIQALRVSDFGTLGLRGPNETGRPFHTLLKGAGVSAEKTATAGGSFGIGKKAAFAVSDLHTVFYSTIYRDSSGTERFLAQGKCTLVSHKDSNGDARRATGYWGTAGLTPIDRKEDVPDWLRRNETGTTSISLGFENSVLWRERIAESLLRNFFASIHREEMEFVIDGGHITLSKNSLEDQFTSESITSASDSNGTLSELEFSHLLYETLISDQAIEAQTNIQGLGAFTLRLLVRDGLPKRVGILRNGMFITDSLQNFGDKLSRFPMYKDFVAVLEPTDDTSIATLRKLENPRHDQFSADRLLDPQEADRVRKSIKKLRQWLRGQIRDHTFIAPEDETDLDEMNEFFADSSPDDRIRDPNNGEPHPEVLTHRPPKRTPMEKPKSADGDEGGAAGEDGESHGGKGGTGPGNGPGAGGTGKRGHKGAIEIHSLRNFKDPLKPKRSRVIAFTPNEETAAILGIEASGMSEPVRLHIKDLTGDGVEGNSKVLSLLKGKRHRIRVEFDEEYEGPIEISLRRHASGEVES